MAKLTPPLGRNQVPPFHEMEWQEFQRFSRELLSRDGGNGLCNEYGVSGQGQEGIDLKKEYDGQPMEVAQCKCWKEVTPKGISDAVSEFLKHATHWRAEGAGKFILIIACDVADTKVQKEISQQKRLLAQQKIKLQVWGARQLEDKLRPHRDIAERYCGEWANRICPLARDEAHFNASATAGMKVMVAQLGDFALELSEERKKELDRLVVLSKQHRFADVLAGLREIKGARSWNSLTPVVRGRVLRFEATTVINLTGDLGAAEKLIEEGRALHPEGDFQVADAYLAYRRGDRPKALELLREAKTLTALNLRLGLLLEIGEADTVISLVSTLPKDWKSDTDTHRYAAYGYLMLNQVEDARQRMDQAMETGSHQPQVREAAAIVRYFSAISPAFENVARHLQWPVPVPWIFVKRDRASLDALAWAAKIFGTLAGEATTAVGDRPRLERWQLACLSCNVSEQPAAQEAIWARLASDSADVAAIVWALSRGYEINRPVAEAALAKKLAGGGGVEECLALVALRIGAEDFTSVERLLTENRGTFEQAGQLPIWEQHMQLARAALGSDGKAAAVDPPEPSVAELTAEFEAKGGSKTLFQLCELKLRGEDWEFVASHAAKLIEGVGTEPALRLALQGLFRAGKHADCLETLEKNRGLLTDGVLSSDLVALRIECKKRLGQLPDALKEARQSFQSHESFPQLLHLFQVQLAAADTLGAAQSARDALQLSGVPSAFYVESSHLLGSFDRELAIALWRKGMAGGIDQIENVQLAYNAAIHLGLDREAGPLMERLMTLARDGKGGVSLLTLAQSREQLQKAARAATDLWQMYARGHLPAHLVTAQTHLSLGRLYHSTLRQNQAIGQPHRGFAAFFRSASRQANESPTLAQAQGQLHLDITALLLGQELGMLDLVEQHFGPLRISPHVAECLFREIELAARAQVSRHPLALLLLRLQRENRLTVVGPPESDYLPVNLEKTMGRDWCFRLAQARVQEGVLVDYSPLRSNTDELAPVNLSEADAAKVWSAADCARASHLAGRLTRTEYEGVLAGLAESTAPKPDEQLRAVLGKPIHLVGNIWERLAGAGILEHLCTVGTVSVERAEIDDAVRMQDQMAGDQDLVATLQALLTRVSDGLKAGRYQLLRAAKGVPDYPGTPTPAEKTLFDLIAAGSDAKGFAWADDRMMSRFALCGTMPFVGTWEILQALRSRNALTREEYFGKLDWLRRANVRYFPVLEEEISFQLREAPLDGASLKETPALATLRGYVASCLLDRERLQPPQPGADNVRQLHDFTFVLELQRGIQEALSAVWRDATIPVVRQQAEAAWIWNNLYFDVASIRQLLGLAGFDPDVAENTVVSLSVMFVRGFMLPAPNGVEDTPRQRYLDWLYTVVVGPFLQTNPAMRPVLAQALAGRIRDMLKGKFSRGESYDPRLMGIVLQRFVLALPEDLVAHMGFTEEEWNQVGLNVHGPSVNIGPYSFAVADFWNRAAEAMNAGESQVVSYQRTEPLHLNRHEDPARPGVLLLKLTDPVDGKSHIMTGEIYPLLLEGVSARGAFLCQYAQLLDGSAEFRAAESTRIAQLPSAAERVAAVQAWQAHSMEINYRQLAADVQRQKGFRLEQINVSDWEDVVRQLGIEDTNGPVAIAPLAARLLTDVGLESAVERVSCLPVALDAALVSAFAALPVEEARVLLGKWETKMRSPIQLVHLLGLWGRLGRSDPAGFAQARAILERLLSPEVGEREFACFLDLLCIVRRSVNGAGSAVRSVPALNLLANWFHAARTHSLLIPNLSNQAELGEFLAAASRRWTADVFDRVPGYWEDVAHPLHLSRGNFLLHGLDAVFRGWPEEVRREVDIPGRIATELAAENVTARCLKLALVRDWSLYRNVLGSFLDVGTIRPATWHEDVALVVSGDREGTLEAARRYVDAILKGDDSRTAWVRLQALLGDAPLPLELHDELKRLVDSTCILPLYQANRPEVGFVLSVLARTAARLGDSVLIKKVEEQVFGLAQECAAANTGNDGRALSLSLVDSLLLLSVVGGDGLATAREFFKRGQRLIQTWPEVATTLKGNTSGWMAELPLDQQGALWPFIVHIRALAK